MSSGVPVRFSGVVIPFALVFLFCAKSESPKTPAPEKDPRITIITSFFSSTFKPEGKINGIWIADNADLATYVETKYLRDYKPLPNENSADKIRRNLKESKYFLRIDGNSCDELFLIETGEFTATLGKLKFLGALGNTLRYDLEFFRRDAKGNAFRERAQLTARPGQNLEIRNAEKRLRFFPEKRTTAELVSTFAKPAPKTGLAEY